MSRQHAATPSSTENSTVTRLNFLFLFEGIIMLTISG